jgi:hypothetical protein
MSHDASLFAADRRGHPATLVKLRSRELQLGGTMVDVGRFLLIAALLALQVGCASRLPTDYREADAGGAVIGIGADLQTHYQQYTFRFRRLADTPGETSKAEGTFVYNARDLLLRRQGDYRDNLEAGTVVAHSMPPGRYEIFNVAIYMNAGTFERTFSSRSPFSIPFEISPGKTTYLGNYQARMFRAPNVFGIQIPAGATFKITDRRERDVEIARKKVPSLPPQVENRTPSASSIGNALFVDQH